MPKTFYTPLTNQQLRLWFEQNAVPDSTHYNISGVFVIKGELNESHFKSALKTTLKAWTIPGTYIVNKNNQLYSALLTSEEMENLINQEDYLISADICDQIHKDVDKEKFAFQYVRSFNQPFDLTKYPLFRILFIKYDTHHYIFGMQMHHIICDRPTLLKGLWIFNHTYNNVQSSSIIEEYHPEQLHAEQDNYASYLKYEVDQTKTLEYWLNKLKNATLNHEFYNSNNSLKGKRYFFAIEGQRLEKFNHLISQYKCSVFDLMASIFFIFLYRYTNNQNLTITYTSDNRPSHLKALLGFYISTLYLNIELKTHLTLVDILMIITQQKSEDLKYRYVNIQELLSQLKKNTTENINCNIMLTQTIFADESIKPLALKNLETKYLGNIEDEVINDLTLLYDVKRNKIIICFEYNEELFNSDVIREMSQSFITIIDSCIVYPNQPIKNIAYLTKEQFKVLTIDYNKNPLTIHPDCSIPDLFRIKAQHFPEKIAVAFGESEQSTLTYQQLDEKSNQLAYYLAQNNTQPFVPIALDRSLDMQIAILGILKAGFAYVPIDLSLNSENIRKILDDLKPGLIITQTWIITKHRDVYERYRVLLADVDFEYIFKNCPKDFTKEIGLYEPAYMIYTSGSTGNPKGVINTHIGLSNRIVWMKEEYKVNENDIFLQKTPYSFDVSVWEFCLPMISGAKLIFAKPYGHKEPEYLYHIIEKTHVSMVHFVPSMLTEFLLYLDREKDFKLHRLKKVFVSGEALTVSLKNKFYHYFKDQTELHNLYGPTEAAIDVTYLHCLPNTQENFVSIGRAISNVRMLILNPELELMPPGAVGELAIVSRYAVAIGYYHLPEKTAKSFIEHSSLLESGERMYLTGDLGRWTEEGDIQLIGRKDTQIKFHGIRIETEEIENILNNYPNLVEVKIKIDDSLQEKYLVAYLVENRNQPTHLLSYDEAMVYTNYLQKFIPVAILPNYYIIMNVFPKTSSGKVNLRELPKLSTFIDAKAITLKPSDNEVVILTEQENILAAVWSSVLKIDSNLISRESDFYAIGGDSILAVQVILECHSRGYELSIADIIAKRKLKEIAKLLSLTEANKIVPYHLLKKYSFNLEEYEDAYPLSNMQIYFLEKYLQDKHRTGIYHVQHAFKVVIPNIGIRALQEACHKVIMLNPNMRTVFFKDEEGQYYQLIRKNYQPVCKIYNLSDLEVSLQHNLIHHYIKKDVLDPFDVFSTKELLLRIKIFVLSMNEAIIFNSFHHSLQDGWSNIEFYRQMYQYAFFIKNKIPIESPVLFNTQKEMIAYEKEAESNEELKAYWVKTLTPYMDNLLLPNITTDSIMQTQQAVLDSDLLTQVENYATKIKIQKKVLFLCAFLKLLANYFNNQTLTTAIVSNCRKAHLTKPLESLGIYWNFLPLISSGKSLPSLDKLQDTLLEMDNYVEYPYRKILADLQCNHLAMASYNYIDFHNAAEFLSVYKEAISMFDYQILDRFDFPINLQVRKISQGGPIYLLFSLKSAILTDNQMEKIVENYLEILSNLSTCH